MCAAYPIPAAIVRYRVARGKAQGQNANICVFQIINYCGLGFTGNLRNLGQMWGGITVKTNGNDPAPLGRWHADI